MRRWREIDPGYVAAAFILLVGAGAASSIDFVKSGFGIKGDEATYVAMALSAAYDGDLAYERRDLERFYELYHAGPEGIFLKRPVRLRMNVGAAWPFVSVTSLPQGTPDRLSYGKAYIYAVAAAPFVRLAGLNGFFLFHVVLLAAVVLAAYRFVAATTPADIALPYALGFFGMSIVPLYLVWLTSDFFNLALVFFAYFLWFRAEAGSAVAGPVESASWGRPSALFAAALLGLATFSKPTNALLVAPPVLWFWWQRRVRAGGAVAVTFGLVVAGAFAANAWVSGDFNYQGGERRTFYGSFPFENTGAGFADRGIEVSTSTSTAVTADEPLTGDGLGMLIRNAGYFLIGRHFGFVPFFFPGAITLLLAAWHWRALRVWHGLIVGCVMATVAATLYYLPYSWSGGGGPSGNRYFLSIYPVLLFVTPPLRSHAPGVVAWLGGALFTAQILMSPFVSAKQPYLAPQHGMLRWLPVELTMVNDLPIMLDAPRARVPFGRDPTLLLYFLDDNAWLPEPPGVWIAGGSRADIVVRTDQPLAHLVVTLDAPVPNRVTLEAGGPVQTVSVGPGRPATVTLQVGGVQARQSWACLLSVRTTSGFVPRLSTPGSADGRFLGVAMQLSGRIGSRLPLEDR